MDKFIKILLLFFAFLTAATHYSFSQIVKQSYDEIELFDTLTGFDPSKAVFTISCTSTNVTCYGLCDGTITINLASGAPNYPVNIKLYPPAELGGGSIDYNNIPALPYTITGLCGAVAAYTVRVVDQDGPPYKWCSAFINSPGEHIPVYDLTDETCPGSCDGSIVINFVQNAIYPLNYIWAPDGEITDFIVNKCSGAYTLTITDANSCSSVHNWTITAPPAVVIDSIDYTAVFCAGGSGSITVYASGGTPPLLYDFGFGFGAANSISGLAAGPYTVTVKDAVNCSAVSNPLVLIENSVITTTAIVDDADCNGDSTGAIDLTVVGGTGPFGFLWTGGYITEDLINIPAGTYDVTVTDIYNCTGTGSYVVGEPGPIIITETHVNPCFGASNGSINITVAGGNPCPGYTYIWSPGGQLTEDISGLSQGTYSVTVTDCDGCSNSLSIDLTQNPQIIITLDSVKNYTCFNSPCMGAIYISVSGGTPGYTYGWSGPGGFNSALQDITGLCITAGLTGTYIVTVTDAAGCTRTRNINITRPSLITITLVSQTNVSCYGACNGAIDITIAGGTPGYSVLWSGPGGYSSTNTDISGLCAGSYSITVTDSRGCTRTGGPYVITQPPDIIITSVNTNVLCNGQCTGAIDVTIAGGTPPYVSYNWTGPSFSSSSDDISNLCAGVYDLTVTDSKPCTKTYSVTITEPPALTVTENITDVTCTGICDGAIDITAGGGNPGYSYNWIGPVPFTSINDDITNLCAGDYDLTITDANACTLTTTYTVASPVAVSASVVTQSNVTCAGLCDGWVQIAGSGGTPPYTYLWNTIPPQFGPVAINLCAGVYTATITDFIGCTGTFSVTITENPVMSANISAQTDVDCGGACNGSATVTANGGTGIYTYLWDDPPPQQTTQTATGLCAGLVSVTVTDENGCTATASTTITEPPPFTAVISDSTMSCGSFPTLVAGTTFLPDDGTGASYTTTITQTEFSPSATINSPSDILSICLNMEHSWAGDLEIKITCPNNQSQILKTAYSGGGNYLGEPVSVGWPDQQSSDVTPGTGYDYCFVSSGALYGTMGATAGIYQYSYTDNAGNPHVNRYYLPQGTYTPNEPFSNLVGCPINGNWTITVTDYMALDNGYIFSWMINYDPSTFPTDYCNGGAVVTTVGGQPPFTYLWTGGYTTDTVTNLCSGQYCVTITDSMGCTASTCVTIIDINLEIDSIVQTNVSCSGLCDGQATVYTSGGFNPLTYLWSNGQTTQTAINLCAGQYRVTVTEDNGCTQADTIIITAPPLLTLSMAQTDITCFGVCNGTATATPAGGTPPYTYSWTGGLSTPGINNLCPGVYSVTVTDDNLCTVTGSVTITEPPLLTALITNQTDVTCNGLCDGSATVTAGGGTPGYTYLWCNGETAATANALCAGVCVVTVTDSNGCTATASVTITEPPVLTAIISNQINVSCNGLCDGSATVTAGGGTPGYIYLWCNGETTLTPSALCAGVCVVTVTDNNGCTTTASVTITEPPALTAIISNQTDITCNGLCDGSATVTAGGGTPAYTYNWCNGETGASASALCAGVCVVTVTDSNGCTATASVTITEPPALTAIISNQTDVTCNGLCDGSATVTAGGGTPGYTYLWCNGETGASASALCAGVCVVTVTDSNGCTATASVTITEPPVLTAIISNQINVSCNGLCDGSATVTAGGGTPGYTYSWCNGETTAISNTLCAGVCVVTVTDSNGCTATASVTITEPPALTAIISNQSNVTCNGLCDGSATVTAGGGTPGYTYLWCNGETGVSASALCAGVCVVTVTDSNGCTTTASVTITEPAVLTSAFTSFTQIGCAGDCSGTLTVEASGGTVPYVSYQWSPNVGTGNFVDSLCAGIHYVTITDSQGCTTTNSFEIIDTSNLQLSLVSLTDPTCYGLCNGTATVVAAGGYPPYTYSWSDSQSGPTAINLCDGPITATVVDDSLCSRQLVLTLVEPAELTFTTSVIDPVCNTDCNGQATATPSGGTPPYTYIWAPGGEITPAITGLCPGVYDVTVSDNNGCVIPSQSVTVTSPPVLTATLDVTQQVLCAGVCNGELTANPAGGVPPYTYSWSPNISETSQVADSLCADTYFVTVTDFNGCTVVATQTLTQPNVLTALITNSTQVACFGDSSGTATATGVDGTPPYSYLWDNNADNQTTATAINLSAGIYFVTVTDLNGCTDSTMVTIIDTSDLDLSVTSLIDPLCYGQCTGEITVQATGGYPSPLPPNYTYTWSDGQSGPTASNLCDGSITVTAIDDSLCSRTLFLTLTEPPLLNDTMGTVPITCPSLCDGSAIVYPFGGTPPYGFNWNIPQFNDTISNLCGGIYYVTITDFNACQKTDSVELISPPVIILTISEISPILCYGSCNGSVSADVTGGTPPYTYLWNNSQTNDTINGLCPGTYILTVTDASSCFVIDSITITQPDSLEINFINVTPIPCGTGNCIGEATAQVTGGTSPYNYQWDANALNQTTPTADSLCANIYLITVTDLNGCTVVDTVTIVDTSSLALTLISTTNISCYGSCDGSATVQASGGNPPYTYLWDANAADQTTPTAVNLCQGSYWVTVYDADTCSRTLIVDITDADVLAVAAVVTPESCPGLCDAEIVLIPSGGTPPYITYSWSITMEDDSIATGLCPATYYFSVTDSNNCTYSDSAVVPDLGIMAVTIQIDNPILCYGLCDGELAAVPTGALGPFTYLWSDNQVDSIATGLCGGNYSVTVTGAGGCTTSASVNLSEPDSLEVTFTNIVQVACGGDCSGSVTASVTGGTPPYFYQWDANAGNETTPMIDTLCANLYGITVTDANGCSQVLSFEITDTSNLTLVVLDAGMISCYGRCDGWAAVTATNGYPPYSYLWDTNPPETLPMADSLCAGFYRVTVTDDSLCSRVTEIEITQPDSIIIAIADSTSISCASDCNGSLTVGITGGTQPFSFIWTNGSVDSVSANLCAGMQQLNITDFNGCTDSMSYLMVSPELLQSLVTAQNALCNTGTNDGNVNTVVSGGVPPYIFLWSNDSTTQNLVNVASGNYWLTITDSLGCQKTDSVTVAASITVNAVARWDTIICYGDSVQIFGFGGNTYVWYPSGGLSDSTLFNPWAGPSQTTTYYFVAFDSVCYDIDSVIIQVRPQIGVYAGTDQSILYDHSTTITATSFDLSATFLWTPSYGLSDTTLASTTAHPLVTTDYIVFATSIYGCVESDTVTINIIPRIIIPTGITPNGDGKNDVWIIDMINYYPNCEVEIYNRWGEKLFYSQGYPDSERWDGMYKGKPLPTGTYYFIINLHDDAEGSEPITGPITLVR